MRFATGSEVMRTAFSKLKWLDRILTGPDRLACTVTPPSAASEGRDNTRWI